MLPALGLGGAPIGNLYQAVPEDVALETVRSAIRLGFHQIDTAPHYGLGLSERRIGAALAEIDRSDTLISTKVGRILEPNPEHAPGQLDPANFEVPATLRRRWDYTPAGLRRSLEESLQRLGLDRVEILYLHDPDVHGLDEGIVTALPEMVRMRDEGLVDRIGVGSVDTSALERCVAEADLDVVMCAGRYSLLEQPAGRRLLPLCLERGVRVMAAGVYNSGALATATMPEQVLYDYAPAPSSVLDRLRRLHDLCAAHGVAVPSAAVQFVGRHPAVEVVVLGARSPAEVRQAYDNARADIPEDFWDDLASSGLVEHAG
ncbi:MAG: aldo/keto reductase [Ornithinimicrobium sp.]|uniref:aldo/keto reductase n=1 Tax=Ornithinimicrobium sp. TaxID=1977084 RepID=UPI003D9BC67B